MSCNAPGTYNDPVTNIDLSSLVHPDSTTYNYMAPTPLQYGSKSYNAAGVWGTLGAGTGGVLGLPNATFCHIMTNTPVHPHEPQVLQLMGATYAAEMFPSVLAKQLAPCLQTLQTQPISVGAATPSEALTFGGQALPTIPPTALQATLTNQTVAPYTGMTKLQALRDSTLTSMYGWYNDSSQTTPAQKVFIDSMVSSQQQVRGIAQSQLAMLSGIKANDNNGQITAAIALILMGVAPVITVHFPFGGDNHSDPAFNSEATQHQTGVAAIVQLLQQLAQYGLSNKVTFLSLNVFGRTMAAYNTAGRQHNQFHEMSMMIGTAFKGGVIGGIAPLDQNGVPIAQSGKPLFDYGSLPINPSSGAPIVAPGSGIQPVDQLASWGATVLTGLGATSETVSSLITDTNAQVIQAALV
jgi:hypothetical protein